MNFYTSDLHLFCQGELKHSYSRPRPFNTLEEMHRTIKENWNRKVTNADHVYILGDLSMKGHNHDVTAFMSGLKGNLHWILGNHDKDNDLRMRKQFVEICPYKELSEGIAGKSYNIVLCHYPIFAWNGQAKGYIHLYGHTHDNFDDKLYQEAIAKLNDAYKGVKGENYKPFSAYNVGCMRWDYEPVSLKEILEKKGKVD